MSAVVGVRVMTMGWDGKKGKKMRAGRLVFVREWL